jgi:hypothetical protein
VKLVSFPVYLMTRVKVLAVFSLGRCVNSLTLLLFNSAYIAGKGPDDFAIMLTVVTSDSHIQEGDIIETCKAAVKPIFIRATEKFWWTIAR